MLITVTWSLLHQLIDTGKHVDMLTHSQLRASPDVNCDMAFIKPMLHKKPNTCITLRLIEFTQLIGNQFQFALA